MSQPPGPAPAGVAVPVSAERAEVLDSFISSSLSFYVPLPPPPPPPPAHLGGPQPSRSPASMPLARCQPLSRAAGAAGGGDPRSRAGRLPALGPLCPGRPSPIARPLSVYCEGAKSSDPWPGELHFRSPRKLPVSSSPKPGEGRSSHFYTDSGAARRPASAPLPSPAAITQKGS